MPFLCPLILFLLLIPGPFDLPVRAQQNTPMPAEAKLEFFSGFVAELDQEHVVVSRSVLGKAVEKRAFKMNERTKVEGRLRAKARVTVGFTASDDGDIALQIIVREPLKKKS